MPRGIRVIPCLLVRGRGLWKTTRFNDPVYVGDPVNVARIFNDKRAHELVVLDIGATHGDPAPRDFIGEIASECFMPSCIGGGIRSLEHIEKLLGMGVEKVAINTHAIENPAFVEEAAATFGSSTITVSIDARRTVDGTHLVYSHGGTRATDRSAVDHAREMADRGAGEILLTSIDREGTRTGYDIDLVRSVAAAVDVPVVAHGGAAGVADMTEAVQAGASAAAAGSLFVFYGRLRGVLVTYPTREELSTLNA
jgi:imidazole glycerol-phosphate synthase subunit HisF